MLPNIQKMPERDKIRAFLFTFGPMIEKVIETAVQQSGYEFTSKGKALNKVLHIHKPGSDLEGELHLYNMYMEIVTVDRDATPLVFDKDIIDEHAFAEKVADIIKGRLLIISNVETEAKEPGDIDMNRVVRKTYETGRFERIRGWSEEPLKRKRRRGRIFGKKKKHRHK